MESVFDLYKPTDITEDNVTISIDVDDWCFLKTMQHRAIEVQSEIDSALAQMVSRVIIQINQDDKGIPVDERVPLKLFISSDGGDVFAGLQMIDIIANSTTPIWTINVGHEYSMAAIVGLAGTKRYATKNASFLIHDGAVSIQDSGSKVHDFIKFDKKLNDRIKNFVLEHSTITAKLFNSRARNEWYFFADDAKKYGMIDGIIGEDISLEEVI